MEKIRRVMKVLNIPGALNKTKDYIALWVEFHNVIMDAIKKEDFTKEEEDKFLEMKSKAAQKFQTLVDILSVDRETVDRTYDVINQILSLKNAPKLSESLNKKLENDWHQVYITLNRLLGKLEAERDSGIKTDRERSGKFFLNIISYIIIFGVLSLAAYFIVHMFGLIRQ